MEEKRKVKGWPCRGSGWNPRGKEIGSLNKQMLVGSSDRYKNKQIRYSSWSIRFLLTLSHQAPKVLLVRVHHS